MINKYNKKAQNVYEGELLKKKPDYPRHFMKLAIWLNTFPRLFLTRHKFNKINMASLNRKEPYIMFVNHNSYMDYKVAAKSVFPYSASNVVALDAHIKMQKLVDWIGGISKRKFVSDTSMVRQILHVLRVHKIPLILYPEARYSLVGTEVSLPNGLAKLIKVAKVPLVILINDGHHIAKPYWHHKRRRIKTESTLIQVVTKAELESITLPEIEARIQKYFKYDDYAWQRKKQIKIKSKKRAEGLHRVLYQCPSCRKENHMHSRGHLLECTACKKTYTLNVYNQLTATKGKTEFSHIPDWFEWQRAQVKALLINDQYYIQTEVDIDVLPDAKGFIKVGKGQLTHSKEGFKLTYQLNGETKTVIKAPKNQYAIHVEYHHAGDKISFSTDTQTYFLRIKDPSISVTKLYLATEELYKIICL